MKSMAIVAMTVVALLSLGICGGYTQENDNTIGVYNEWGKLKEVFLGIEDDTIEPDYVSSLVWIPDDGKRREDPVIGSGVFRPPAGLIERISAMPEGFVHGDLAILA